jgi:c-di-GMP-binding flagellar brake protein YcgR
MGNVMPNKRKFDRFKVNDLKVHGKMALATEVRIIDISTSGISLKVNRSLKIGSDYTLKLEGKQIVSLKGTVIWCSLSEIREGSPGDSILTYSAGMQFKDMSTESMTQLQYLIESNKIREVQVIGGTRLNIRFHIEDPEHAILICPDDYKVKTISLAGMLIEYIRNFKIESRIPMEMFIHDDNHLRFMGRVASSQAIEKDGQEHYEIGIEFLDLPERDLEILASFIEQIALADTETGKAPEKTA